MSRSESIGLNESEQRKNLGELLECIRITYGLKQVEYAEILGVAQSTVSKLERGELSLSAFQWCSLADKLKLPIETVKHGFLDNKTNSTINNWRNENGYFIPKVYAQARCIKVRSLLPLMTYLDDKQGPGYLSSILKDMVSERKGVDCFPRKSFFLNLDNQVGLAFMDNFLHRVKNDIGLSEKIVTDISSYGALSESHGYLAKSYHKMKDGMDLVKQFTQLTPKYHSLITNTMLESSTDKISLSWKINQELEDNFNARSELFKNFIEQMFTGVFESLQVSTNLIRNKSYTSTIRFKKYGSFLKDDKRIIYEIYAA